MDATDKVAVLGVEKSMGDDLEEPTKRRRSNDHAGHAEHIIRARWKSLFNFTSKSHVGPLVIGLLLSVASGIIIPALAVFLGKIFESFSEFSTGALSGPALKKRISLYGVELVGLGSASWLLNGSYFSFWLAFGELQAKSVRDKLFDGMLRKDLEWYDMRKAGIGAMIPRLQTQIRELQIAASQPLGFTIQYTVTTFAALGLALYSSWNLTLVTLSTVPISAVFLAWISARMQPGIDAQVEELIQASKFANSAILAIDTVKCFNGQDSEIWQYATAVKRAARYYLVQARVNALQIGFVRIVTLSMFVQGFWYGSHLVEAGKKNPGQILTAFWACLMATQTIEQLLPQMLVLEKGRVAGATLKAVLVKMEKGRKVTKMLGRKTPRYCDGDVQFKNVSFAYPSRPDQLALNDVSLFFPAGETTFVVGKSGSGKSTLGNLLMHFYKPGSGEISIDGDSIKTLDTNWLRNNITLIQQQSVLFNETIFKNIAFGRRDHGRVSKDEVKKCIDATLLQNIINGLPQGLDTLVGVGGNSMSGGQKQRVAIARARLRDTPILVLDEATSALDHATKTLVMDAIREWRRGKTTIFITHDISQIHNDDFIYVLEKGTIVQEGYRHALQTGKAGPFSGSIQTSIHFPRPPSGNQLCKGDQSSLRDERNLSSQDLIFSADSMDVPYEIRAGQVSVDYSTTLEERRSRRPSKGLIAPLPTVALRMHRMSTTRMSILPTRSLPKSIEPFPPVPVQSDVEMLERKSRYSFINRPRAVESNRRASYHFSQTSIGYSKPPRLKALLPNVKGQATLIKKAERISSLMDILGTVWPMLTWLQRLILISGFLFAFVHAAATPIFSWVFSNLLASFFLPSGRTEVALKWSLSVLGVAIGDAVASYFMHFLLESCAQAWVDALRVQAMKRVLDQPRAWFYEDINSLSALSECLDRNAEEMRNLVGRFAAFLFVAGVMMSIAFIWSLIVCWKLTLVGLSSAPFLYGVTRGFQTVSGRWEGLSNEASDIAGAIFTETFTNIRTVRALTLEGYFHKKYIKATVNTLRVGLCRAAFSGVFFGLSDAGIVFVTALLFYYGAILVSSHEYTTQNILLIFTMLLFSIANVNGIVAYVPQINSSRDTATRLLRLATLPYKVSHEHTGHIRLSHPGTIRFTDLTFAYPSRPTHPVLSLFSLNFPSNSFTALVGASGSGKSTVAFLLFGLYPPNIAETTTSSSHDQDRHIQVPPLTIAGHDMRTLHMPTLRSLIALVPQQPILFPASLAANITYGLPESSPLAHLANIRHAARLASIDDFINSLPQGYSTPVGEGGTGLSGGQVQRVGIARALVRRPKVLVLDEPTSALDGESAREVRGMLRGLVSGGLTTVVVITHEREMMRVAGRVAVLKGGGVVEEGAYEEVVGRRGGELRRLMMGDG